MLQQGFKARVEKKKVPVLPIFDLIQKTGNIPEHDMFNTFNMGIGMCMAVPAEKADEAMRVLKECGEEPHLMGEIAEGNGEVEIC